MVKFYSSVLDIYQCMDGKLELIIIAQTHNYLCSNVFNEVSIIMFSPCIIDIVDVS